MVLCCRRCGSLIAHPSHSENGERRASIIGLKAEAVRRGSAEYRATVKRKCEHAEVVFQNAHHRINLVATPGSPVLRMALSRKESKIACEGDPLLILDSCIRTCRRGHKYRVHGLLNERVSPVAHAPSGSRTCRMWRLKC